jgi:L-amino acid N-acyltransferase YncA
VTPTARDQPDTLVRPAGDGDVPGLVAVAATRGALPDGFDARARAWVADPGRRVVVGDRSGVVVGWAMLARWSGYDDVPDGLYVSALTVDPAHRRRGTGARLLADLLAWADRRGGPVRSVVNARNAPSLALHAAQGFREVRRAPTLARIGFDGGTGVLLRRDGREDQA